MPAYDYLLQIFLKDTSAGTAPPAGEGGDLKLVHVEVLLADYRRLALSAPASALAAPPPMGVGGGGSNGGGGAGRFLRLSAADARLGDLPPLLAAYRTLLAAQ